MTVQGPHNPNRAGLIGALVTSDKPIALNCGSFGGSNAQGNLDLGFDQIVPLERISNTEYIFIKSTGAKAGSNKSPESTWSLTGLKGTELGGFPKLTQTMVTQCWLAHPKHRTPYMILDPQNWDAMPPPLVDGEIFKQPTPQKPTKYEYPESLPWD